MRKKYLRHSAMIMAIMVGVSTMTVSPVEAKAVKLTLANEQLDTDSDGLQDYLEEYFGTDKEKADTDKDGISDYIEVIQLHTNPLKKDSCLDSDGDKLTNLEEVKLGTDLLQADTDQDGLKDGVEVKQYHTNPSKEDSDKDGLTDGEEVELKLNPLKKATDSKHQDANKKFAQVLDTEKVDDELLSKENAAVPSISGKVQGVMDNNISVESSSVVLESMKNNVVGMPVEVVSDYEKNVNMQLSFDCKKAGKTELSKYRIVHYKNGKLRCLDTEQEQKKISADITEEGTYFVVKNVSAFKAVKKLSLASPNQDSDFDGIEDAYDKTPQDNSFSGTIHNDGFKINSKVDYAIDYRSFFKPANEFNSQLCKAACIYANMAYGFTISDQQSGKDYSLQQLMAYQGLSDASYYDLEASYSDYDVTRFFMGHRTVTFEGKTKNVVVVAVQGTGDGIKQWQSNFDVGTTQTFQNYSDWTTKENHKGFDVPANRVKRIMSDYLNQHCSDGNETVFLVTGHSRGAAVANLVGAKLTDEGKTAYTYTFATPNTTTNPNANSAAYHNIFNIINKEDFVPCLPCTRWSFRRFGRSSLISIADNYEKEWEKLTGIFDYNPDTFGMQDTVNALADIFNTRNEAYIYTCNCHGTGTKNDITIRNYGMSKNSRENAIAKIPANALPWGKITRYNGKLFWGWDFTVCQCPQYFMQVLAAEMGGAISTYRFVVELNIADHYEDAKTAIIKSAIGGLEHPHYSESYYVLANHASAADFS